MFIREAFTYNSNFGKKISYKSTVNTFSNLFDTFENFLFLLLKN